MDDKKQLRNALTNALLLTSLPWIVELINSVPGLDLEQFGLYPLQWKGLFGILTMPFLHSGWMHLMSNTPPLFLLTFGLFVFYEKKAWRILICLYLYCGLLTWLMGRENSVHVGSSGLAYALAAFHFVSGIIRRVTRQLAFALLVVFLYGGFIWAFFPTIYMDTNISWEGHLSGSLAGILFAVYFRRLGPPLPAALPDDEDDDNDPNDKNAYWKLTEEENESTSP